MKLALIDTGEIAHDTKHLSMPTMLKSVNLAGINLDIYAYAQSATRYPDLPGIDDDRRKIEKERFSNTWQFLNQFGSSRWEQLLEDESITAILLAMDEGVCDTRFNLIKHVMQKRGDISLFIKPPLARSITRAKELENIAEKCDANLSIWSPLRFASGVMQAHSFITGSKTQRRSLKGRISSCTLSFATVAYPKFLATVEQYVDVIIHLIDDFDELTVRATGTANSPVFTISALHTNGSLGSYTFSSHRFLQQLPHARAEILTPRQELLVLDGANFTQCSYFSSEKENSHVAGHSHDNETFAANIRLLDQWYQHLFDGPSEMPRLPDAIKTMQIIEILKYEADQLHDHSHTKADYKRTKEGFKRFD